MSKGVMNRDKPNDSRSSPQPCFVLHALYHGDGTPTGNRSVISLEFAKLQELDKPLEFQHSSGSTLNHAPRESKKQRASCRDVSKSRRRVSRARLRTIAPLAPRTSARTKVASYPKSVRLTSWLSGDKEKP